ncbi:hypothetical protein EZV62_000932 [Acer yangbiense]|uniref:Ubiquitin-like domain-containing protein n=1 Tax=Acer yangbiense TaxID=1000413 RepID=A0A5C7ISI2_9ROSI|nr:hypothetical protein EZV62_000932 [Acer yangbiense]
MIFLKTTLNCIVTWVENMEVPTLGLAQDDLFWTMVNSNLAFGARQWVTWVENMEMPTLALAQDDLFWTMVNSNLAFGARQWMMDLYFMVRKTIAMKVKKSETIGNLKVMLREKEGISEDLQVLSFNGQGLWHDFRRIMDEDIAMNSIYYMSPRTISEKVAF